ncbi:MAG: flagellar motor switch protein FliN [Nitrospirota bacterium]
MAEQADKAEELAKTKEEPTVTDAELKADKPSEVKTANFEPLEEQPSGHPPDNLDFILDIPLEISVQLGATKMLIKDLLQLSQGSVIELDKLAGEPMEILINSRLIARGEVVVVNEKFGIRLTDVVSPVERIKQLK